MYLSLVLSGTQRITCLKFEPVSDTKCTDHYSRTPKSESKCTDSRFSLITQIGHFCHFCTKLAARCLTTLTVTGLQVWCWSNCAKQACIDKFQIFRSLQSRALLNLKTIQVQNVKVGHETKFSLKISYSTHVCLAQLVQHLDANFVVTERWLDLFVSRTWCITVLMKRTHWKRDQRYCLKKPNS